MSHHRRLRITGAAVAAVLAILLALSGGPAGAAPHGPAAGTAQPGYRTPMGLDGLPVLPAPPEPPAGLPAEPDAYRSPDALLSALARKLIVDARTGVGTLLGHATAVPAPPQAVTWGGRGSASALVVYDTTNTWGFLGELYAMAAGNLASHFGQITAEPVADYVSGQVNDYTATIYLGSTYNEPIPAAFLNDVLSTARPVIWAGDNIWQLTGSEGSAADTAFESVYGWDPSSSYFDSTDNPSSVSYKGETFTRNADNGADLLAPHITNSSLVTVLAQANCTDSGGQPANCATIAQSSGTSFPWAIRSSNLTYVGEVPFSYISETDRYVAFSDLLFPALDPTATPSHLALVRLEDVNGTSSPAQIDAITSYLSSQGVPFSINVIPQYLDPNGVNNNGVPVSQSIGQSPSMVAALRNAEAHGATLIQEGYTHQYSNVANPYDGVSGDDAEFYTRPVRDHAESALHLRRSLPEQRLGDLAGPAARGLRELGARPRPGRTGTVRRGRPHPARHLGDPALLRLRAGLRGDRQRHQDPLRAGDLRQRPAQRPAAELRRDIRPVLPLPGPRRVRRADHPGEPG